MEAKTTQRTFSNMKSTVDYISNGYQSNCLTTYYIFVARHSGKVLDVQGYSKEIVPLSSNINCTGVTIRSGKFDLQERAIASSFLRSAEKR
jgi:hypothetical protein